MSTRALSSATPEPPITDERAPARLVSLDVLRGVAVTGIVVLNVPGLTRWTSGGQQVFSLAPWLEELAHGRFVGVLAFLFGISCALVLDGAALRAARPRAVLARRLAVLLALGAAHLALNPGDVLTAYALTGLLLVLPLSFVRSPWVPVALGVAALAVLVPLHVDPTLNFLGLLLLGYGAARLGLPARLERPGRAHAAVGALLVLAVVVTAALQRVVAPSIADGVSYAYTWADYVAAVTGAACLVVVVPLLLATRLRPLLRAVFEPVGRAALSCYVGVTLLALAARGLADGYEAVSTGPDLALAAALVVAQVLVSRWWLARHQHGPLERAWRWGTWWRVQPLHQEQAGAGR